MKVPLLDLKPHLETHRREILEAVTRVIDSTRYIMGPEVEGLEREIADYCGVPNAVGVSSGTDALLLSLMALDVGPNDLVLTTDFSFFATAGVISRLHATPVFLDIDPLSFNLDPGRLDQELSRMDGETLKRVKALIVVHLYGQCADMDPIIGSCKSHGIPVIEDAAQAIGAQTLLHGKPRSAGSIGDFGCFSFFPSKNLGGIGDGGIITTQDPELAKILRLKRVHGGERKYYHRVIGGNFRLDPVQAAVIRVKLPYLNQWHEKRRENAHYYNLLFAEADLKPWVQTPRERHSPGLQFPHIFNQYVIRADRRDELREHLLEREVASEIYYPLAFHQQQCFADLHLRGNDFPESVKAAGEVLALPVYPEITRLMQEYVVSEIQAFYKN